MSKKSHPTNKIIFAIAALTILIVAAILILLNKTLNVDYHNLTLGALAIIDIILIVVVIVEISELQKHKAVTINAMDSITGSVSLLERDKVYVYLEQTARNANRYVHHVSFAQSSLEINDEEEKKRVNRFLSALETACRNLANHPNGPDVKILGPDLSSKIGGLWERKIIKGCDVRVSPYVPMYDIRVQIVDGKNVVIGIAEPAKESERGFLIESETLATILDEMFMRVWNNSTSLDDSTEQVVLRHVVDYMTSVDKLRQLMRGSLNVANDQISSEIINLLVNGKGCLITDGDQDLYQKNVLTLFQQQAGLADDELRKHLENQGLILSHTSFAKFRDFVLKLKGGEVGNPGASSKDLKPPRMT
jgi:hypothetical protein